MTDDPRADTSLRGASATAVRAAIRDREPWPGLDGFAGVLSIPEDALCAGASGPSQSVLVRDVLGREPLFVESDAADPTRPGAWSFDPRALSEPTAVPAGSILTATETRRHWSVPTPPAAEAASAQRAVDDALDAALSSLCGGGDGDGDGDGGGDSDSDRDDDSQSSPSRIAVAFSGGVDSAVVASGLPRAPCYVAGFEGCHDIEAARAAATAMDRDLRVVELTHEAMCRAVVEVAAAIGRTNPMDLAIAIPLYLTAEAAVADGIDRLAVGQGADELFGGYSKVVEPAADHRVEATTVRGARAETVQTLPAQLERDVLTLRAAGVEPVAPLLSDALVDAALRLPASLLATTTTRKVAFRRAASGRVPDSVRTADKKAVQYGTYVSRELDRLARQNGFKRRMDDHVGQYIETLVADARS